MTHEDRLPNKTGNNISQTRIVTRKKLKSFANVKGYAESADNSLQQNNHIHITKSFDLLFV